MARRRTSPLPHRVPDFSDSDDILSHSSEDELFLEQEDPQNDLREQRSVWSSLFSAFRSDPHAPKSIPLSRRDSRREKRRSRRAARKAKRRGRDSNVGSSVMYEADDGLESFRDDDSDRSDWSDNEKWQQGRSKPRRGVFRKFCNICWCSMLACIVIVFAIFGAISAFRPNDKESAGAPSRKPAILFNNGTSIFGPTTILISLDGFRADFLDEGITPALSSFVSNGVSPKYMLPSFPSVTFPNHWTLVTGMYPESHGVVGNSFWDESLAERFYYTDTAHSMYPKWWDSTGAEPLWATAEKQGIRSAVHMWPGSEAGLQPPPTYLDKYNGKEKLSRKVDSVLSWLDLPSPFDDPKEPVENSIESPRPQFISMYVPDVDRDGHNFGPNSTEVRSTVAEVDDMVAKLLSGLESRNLTNIVNVVIVSDHGMATTSRGRLVQLEDLVDPTDMDHIDGWPLYGLRPKTGVDIDQLHSSLKSKLLAAGDNPGWSVYTHDTMPERWHFKSNPRIAPIFLIPDAGWSIVTKDEMDLSDPSNKNAVYHPRGIHGYDNRHPLMRAIFVAKGPSFPHPPGSRLRPFQNTEVYNIVCDSLGVVAQPNNGTLSLPLTTEGIHGDGGPGDSQESTDTKPEENTPPTNDAAEAKPEAEPEPEPEPNKPNIEDKLSQTKEKLKGLWDSLRQGFGKVKGWLADSFGGKKGAPP